MKFNVSNINKFLFFKLPSAYWTGVRMKDISDTKAVTTVKHGWK
ncbi:MAG: thioesterase, partial [Myroides sp.]|nr:thioesterase [Myroides sp.]